MATARTVQTAFRFTPDLLTRLKLKARREHKSVNAYVEHLIEKDLGKDEDRYEALYRELAKIKLPEKISPKVNDLLGICSEVDYSQEELDADPRLAYLIEKHLL